LSEVSLNVCTYGKSSCSINSNSPRSIIVWYLLYVRSSTSFLALLFAFWDVDYFFINNDGFLEVISIPKLWALLKLLWIIISFVTLEGEGKFSLKIYKNLILSSWYLIDLVITPLSKRIDNLYYTIDTLDRITDGISGQRGSIR
jgi:hypothetical protein